MKDEKKNFFLLISVQSIFRVGFRFRFKQLQLHQFCTKNFSVHTNTNHFTRISVSSLMASCRSRGVYIEQQDVPGICRTFLVENLPCNISVKSDSSGQAGSF